MLAFYHICFLLSLKFFFSDPFKSLQTWCPLTPKYFSIYFFKTRDSFTLSHYNDKNHVIIIDTIIYSVDLIQILPVIWIMSLREKENPRSHALHSALSLLLSLVWDGFWSLCFMTLILLKTADQLFCGSPSICASVVFSHV